MEQKSLNGKNLFVGLMGVLCLIGFISIVSEPRCIKDGCYHEPTSGSNYCFWHKWNSDRTSYRPYSSGYSSGSNSSNKSNNANSSSNSTTNRGYTTNYNYSSGSSSIGSYDEGYEDIYFNEDYDEERYENDSDYANGVDDAMEDEGW